MITVLHVDDDADIREIAGLALSLDPEIKVVSAASGAEALETLRAGLRPDAILLDVMMPVLDGPAVLAQVRQMPELDATPVIFMTARAQVSEQAGLIQLGGAGVVVKPFDPLTLSRQLRALLPRAGG